MIRSHENLFKHLLAGRTIQSHRRKHVSSTSWKAQSEPEATLQSSETRRGNGISLAAGATASSVFINHLQWLFPMCLCPRKHIFRKSWKNKPFIFKETFHQAGLYSLIFHFCGVAFAWSRQGKYTWARLQSNHGILFWHSLSELKYCQKIQHTRHTTHCIILASPRGAILWIY